MGIFKGLLHKPCVHYAHLNCSMWTHHLVDVQRILITIFHIMQNTKPKSQSSCQVALSCYEISSSKLPSVSVDKYKYSTATNIKGYCIKKHKFNGQTVLRSKISLVYRLKFRSNDSTQRRTTFKLIENSSSSVLYELR